jgi:hypothetical protein
MRDASCLCEQVIPGTGELVIFGFNLDGPYRTVGIVSGFTIYIILFLVMLKENQFKTCMIPYCHLQLMGRN